jgi:hypothetical protein
MSVALPQLMILLQAGLAGKLMQFSWQIFVLPWTVILFCLSTWAGFLLRFLVIVGAPPSGYADQSTVSVTGLLSVVWFPRSPRANAFGIVVNGRQLHSLL